MTDERLAAIRAMLEHIEVTRQQLYGLPKDDPRARLHAPPATSPALRACHELLAEVERLHAREKALEAVVDHVAHGQLERVNGIVQCVWCGQPWGSPDFAVKHRHNCLVNIARALLAGEGEVHHDDR